MTVQKRDTANNISAANFSIYQCFFLLSSMQFLLLLLLFTFVVHTQVHDKNQLKLNDVVKRFIQINTNTNPIYNPSPTISKSARETVRKIEYP